jgi:uncharacterized protein YbjQ (UPF0145 family)
MSIRPIIFAIVTVWLMAGQASARSTDHLMPIQEAMNSGLAKEKLLDVPVFFAGQSHPAVAKTIATHETNKSTRGVFRSDEAACQVAFLSAVIQLQSRAQSEGADAVIDIESITRGKPHSSATEYRCVAGATVVHVGLKGTLVKSGK